MFRGAGFWGACGVWVVAAWFVRGWVWVLFVWLVWWWACSCVLPRMVCGVGCSRGVVGCLFGVSGRGVVVGPCFCCVRVGVRVFCESCGVSLLGLCRCYWVVVLVCLGARVRALVLSCLWGAIALALVGGRGCLGAGCVVRGGVLPVWLRGAVASGGVSVGFDVGERVFMLGGVSAPASGSSLAVSGSVSVSGSVVPVLPDAGVGASDSSGGVRVCVPCAVRVFGDSWCSLVLRRWARAAGVDGVKVDVLLGSAPGSGSGPVVSGSVLSSRGGVVSSGLLFSSPSPGSGGSASLRSPVGGGRVGVGFGARVCDWGARVGVGGGVVSGGGVVAGWWGRARGRVSGLVGGVGVKGVVLLGGVFFVVLVSVLVCFL